MIILGNGVAVELLAHAGLHRGLGSVTLAGTPLRTGLMPMHCVIRSPGAVEWVHPRVVSRVQRADTIELELQGERRTRGAMEWMLHATRPRMADDWNDTCKPDADTRLSLRIAPASRRLGGLEFQGLRYQYRFNSKDLAIYKLLDLSTWEPGGHATGSEFWMRNCFAPPIARFEDVQQHYSTEWYLPGSANPNVFQFLPLQTELQGFTLTASRAGVLITWATEVRHIRSLFEKPRGQDVITHSHEHCGDLSTSLDSAPMEVLFVPGSFSRERLIEIYLAMRDLVHATLHEQIGMRRERVTSYALLEEWGPPDLDDYAENAVPALLDQGVRTIGLANQFRNNMNVLGVSNMCCTLDWQFPDAAVPSLRRMCDRAKASGARVEMWGNTALSTLAHLLSQKNGSANGIHYLPADQSLMHALADAREPYVRTPSGAIDADHYSPAFCVLNLRDSTVRQLWLDRWQAAKDEVGLGGIFLDSSFNLSSDKFHYVARSGPAAGPATPDQTHLLGAHRPVSESPARVLSQYPAHLELMCRMQEMGFVYNNEDVGVFGLHRHGPGAAARVDTLFMWSDCLVAFDRQSLSRAGADPDDVFFRGLAYRMMWMLHWVPSARRLSFLDGGRTVDPPGPWHLGLIRAYDQVEHLMLRAHVLPREQGVIYHHGPQAVLWCFEQHTMDLKRPHSFCDVLSGEQTHGTRLHMERHHLYLLNACDSDAYDEPPVAALGTASV